MRKSDSNEENRSAPRSPEEVLGGRLLRDLTFERIERQLEEESPYPEDTIARIEANIRDFQANCTGLAFDDLIALTNGETGSLDIYHEDDRYQQGKIDLEALQLLYGTMRYTGESPEDAAKLAYIYYYHTCEDDEDDRKFSEWPESYRQDQLREAIEAFDFGDWHQWRRRENADGFDRDDYRNWTGDYGDTCYDITLALIDIACKGLHPEDAISLRGINLPTSSEHIQYLVNEEYREDSSFTKIGGVSTSSSYANSREFRFVPMKAIVQVAHKVDDEIRGEARSEDSYKNVIRRLRKRGILKWAVIKPGQDYRIYPSDFPDPPEANRVRFEGEVYVPETESEPTEGDAGSDLMTDGGASMDSSEAKQNLERIREARDGGADSTDSPETFTCPIEGCSRTVIGSPDALRSHVRQSGEESHRHRTLNEELEIEFDEESYHSTWGPGLREESEEPDSIYTDYEGDWGPGAPV